MSFISRYSTASIFGAILLASCGGGGGSSSSTSSNVTPPVTTPPPTMTVPADPNTPVAVASTSTSKITGGGRFTVNASNSTDPNGDNLTFTWIQTDGPPVLPGGTIQTPTLSLSAPVVTQNTALTFEVTASDGENSSADTVTVTAEPIGQPVTVRPTAPINTTVAALIGITNEGLDQYRVYWMDGFATTANNIIASQVFSDAGAPVGAQRNGSFALPQAGASFSTQIFALVPLSVIASGGTIYAPLVYGFQNAVPHLGGIIGPLEGNLSPVGDPFIPLEESSDFDFTPVGANDLLSVISLNNSIASSITLGLSSSDGNSIGLDPAYQEVAPVGDPSATVSTVSNPAVTAIDDDGFIVAWRRDAIDGTSTVEAQIYTSDNMLSGANISIDSSTGASFSPVGQVDAATFGSGDALVTWVESFNTATSSGFSVRGRVVSPEGAFVTDEFAVSESVMDQIATHAIPLNNGDVLVIWGESDETIKARIISSNSLVTSRGAEFDLVTNVLADNFLVTQTDTGRVVVGYNDIIGNAALTSAITSFCPVGCE